MKRSSDKQRHSQIFKSLFEQVLWIPVGQCLSESGKDLSAIGAQGMALTEQTQKQSKMAWLAIAEVVALFGKAYKSICDRLFLGIYFLTLWYLQEFILV